MIEVNFKFSCDVKGKLHIRAEEKTKRLMKVEKLKESKQVLIERSREIKEYKERKLKDR